MTAIRRDPTYPNVLRRPNGRWISIGNDPAHPWVLLDNDLHEPVIRCATRDECREYRRAGGGKIVHVLFEERMTA